MSMDEKPMDGTDAFDAPECALHSGLPMGAGRGASDNWLQLPDELDSTGLVVLGGHFGPSHRLEDSHADFEIAVPGPMASVHIQYQTECGQRRTREVSGHHVSIIPPGQPHRVEWRKQADLTVLFLSPKLIGQAAAEMFDGCSPLIIENYTAIDAALRQLALTASATYRSGQPTSKLFASSFAHVLALHLVRHYGVGCARVATGNRLPSRVLRRATEFMVSNMARGIQLEDVARAAGLSSFHFAHMFKHTTGMGPHRYLTMARVERLKELLRATETTLNELALSVGFADQSHMTRVFKRFTGATPNAYRRALQS
jgi:AraC family transcriptional regulator